VIALHECADSELVDELARRGWSTWLISGDDGFDRRAVAAPQPRVTLEDVSPDLRIFLTAGHLQRIHLAGLDAARAFGLIIPSRNGCQLNTEGLRLQALLERSRRDDTA
jgi:hypothetical protein